MTDQTKAQRLVYRVEHTTGFDPYLLLNETAAELRRLDENEAALVKALKSTVAAHELGVVLSRVGTVEPRALITRIEAERNAK